MRGERDQVPDFGELSRAWLGIRHQPGIGDHSKTHPRLREDPHECGIVAAVIEEPSAVVAAVDHMVNHSTRRASGVSWHGGNTTETARGGQ